MKSKIILSKANQKTIETSKSYTGIGLQSGKMSTVKFKPSKEDKGIFFCRTDLPGKPMIPANIEYVTTYRRRTKLGINKATIEPVEHILAAVMGYGIDNIIIEVDGPEIPIGDGSALPFIDTLKSCGIKMQKAKKKYIEINEPISISLSEENHITIFPDTCFKIDYRYNCKGIISHATMNSLGNFITGFGAARTFCFEDELDKLNEMKLIKGINDENVLVIKDMELMNKNKELRYHNEYAKHKILDVVGDLALLGYELKGSIFASRSGHRNNYELMKKIIASL